MKLSGTTSRRPTSETGTEVDAKPDALRVVLDACMTNRGLT